MEAPDTIILGKAGSAVCLPAHRTPGETASPHRASSLMSAIRPLGGRAEPARPAPESSSQQIAGIQDALRTRAAIRSYESDHGLLAPGQPSAELLQHMRRNIQSAPRAPAAVDATAIAGILSELRLRGSPIPRITGQMDSQSRQAIRDYQQGQGVAVTREPSAALLAELRAVGSEPVPAAGLTRKRGGPHRSACKRDSEGRMTVTRNDEIPIDIVDSTADDRFDGFSLINAGGDWTLYEVIVEDRG